MKLGRTVVSRPGFSWTTLLGLVVTAACLVLFFLWVPIGEAVAALLAARPLPLVAAMAATAGNLAFRGVRFNALLGRAIGHMLGRATAVCLAGLAINATVPGRVGEVIRIGLAVKLLEIRLGTAVVVSLIERILDLVLLSALGFAALALMGPGIGDPDHDAQLAALTGSMLALALAAISVVLVASHDRLGLWLRETLARRIAAPRWRRRFRRFCVDIRNGARRFLHPRTAVTALALSLVMWLMLGVNIYLVGLAMPGVQCTLMAAMAFAVITTLASALPSAPGAWGVYEAVGVLVGTVLVDAESMALLGAFVIATHVSQQVPVVLGGLSWWLVKD